MVRAPSVGELLRAAFELYRHNVRLVLTVTVPIVILVTGLTALGLGELTAHVKPAPPLRDAYVDLAASQLVTAPLITAILARLVVSTGRGEAVNATDLVADGLELFPAVLLVILAWLGVSFLGFVSLIVPGIYIFVSWYFVVQAVVIDGDRGFAPIRRSAALVRGHWWQSAVVGIAFRLAALAPQAAIVYALTPLASSVNSYAVVVIAGVIASVIALPVLAIGASLYYLYLRDAAAKAARACGAGQGSIAEPAGSRAGAGARRPAFAMRRQRGASSDRGARYGAILPGAQHSLRVCVASGRSHRSAASLPQVPSKLRSLRARPLNRPARLSAQKP